MLTNAADTRVLGDLVVVDPGAVGFDLRMRGAGRAVWVLQGSSGLRILRFGTGLASRQGRSVKTTCLRVSPLGRHRLGARDGLEGRGPRVTWTGTARDRDCGRGVHLRPLAENPHRVGKPLRFELPGNAVPGGETIGSSTRSSRRPFRSRSSPSSTAPTATHELASGRRVRSSNNVPRHVLTVSRNITRWSQGTRTPKPLLACQGPGDSVRLLLGGELHPRRCPKYADLASPHP
jgi:hypothetical protein